jgi:hypothetical protein
LPELAHKKLAITRIKLVFSLWQVTVTGDFKPSPQQMAVLERLPADTLRALRNGVERSESPHAARALILDAINDFEQSDNA